METEPKKQGSRRKKYTQQAIKDAMLDLLAELPYDKISVASLCRKADIGRATFYMHYDSLSDVIKELGNDAILSTPHDGKELTDIPSILEKLEHVHTPEQMAEYMSYLPVCQRVVDNPRYSVLFRDPAVADYILMQIYLREKQSFLDFGKQQLSLDARQAELLFLHMLTGCFAVNKSLGWKKSEDWLSFQKTLLAFLEGGYQALQKKGRK